MSDRDPITIESDATAWLERATDAMLCRILLEYRYFVHRFALWLGITIAKTSDRRIQVSLLPNFLEEAGVQPGKPHLQLLDELIRSCGLSIDPADKPMESTRRIEAWFFDACAQQDTHIGLCVLGPGTEAVSQQFLRPLETGVRIAFSNCLVDYSYFDAHRTEVEADHALSIERAIELIESGASLADREKLVADRKRWVGLAICQHTRFWKALRDTPRLSD